MAKHRICSEAQYLQSASNSLTSVGLQRPVLSVSKGEGGNPLESHVYVMFQLYLLITMSED